MANEQWLIDANALSDAVYKSKHNNPHPPGIVRVNHRNEHDHFLRMIYDATIVDAVEVVRCENCKYAIWDEEDEMWKCVESAEYDENAGEWFGFYEYHNGDFFCAYGEEKDNA